jgi:hypothetical protein
MSCEVAGGGRPRVGGLGQLVRRGGEHKRLLEGRARESGQGAHQNERRWRREERVRELLRAD